MKKFKMNNTTIRKRVALYYSTTLIVISLLLLVVFLATGSHQVDAISRDTVMKAVQNSFDEIEYSNDVLEIDSDFDAYSKGVSLLVYGENGNLIKGSLPKDFPPFTPLTSSDFQVVENKADNSGDKWIVYDLYNSYDRQQGLWIRGIYAMHNSVQTLKAVTLITIFLLPLILFLALFAGWRITKHAFDPIKEITDAANAIGSGHDLSKRLPQGETRDELFYLTETLNEMMERLEEAFIAEKQFTSDVSHELRTPISVILSECEYVLSENRSAAEYTESIEVIQQQCRRTMSLIQQLLQLSRTFNKEGAVEKEWFDLSVLAKSIVDELSKTAADKGVHLTADVSPNLKIYGDETLIMRLMMNLMTNGIKYKNRLPDVESFVHLEVKRNAGDIGDRKIMIAVSDNGIGIKKEDLDLVFHRFYKVDKSRTAKADSFGLGLSMVKWIAEAHDGSVILESTPGEGSKFTVQIPLPSKDASQQDALQ